MAGNFFELLFKAIKNNLPDLEIIFLILLKQTFETFFAWNIRLEIDFEGIH